MIRYSKWVFYRKIVKNGLTLLETMRLLHAMAAGASLKYSNVDKLVNFMNKELANIDFNEKYWEADFIVNANSSYLSDLIDDMIKGKEFWGQGCPEPIVVIENITIDSNLIQYKGENRNTIAFVFNGIEYIKFKDDDLVMELSQYNGKITMTIVGVPQINEWCGRVTKQFRIESIDIKESNEFDF